MKKLYHHIINTFFRQESAVQSSIKEVDKFDLDSSKMIDYLSDNSKIKIENHPFRLSGLLHIITNRISEPLKEHKHTLHYDVDKGVGRYIVGDNDHIDQILEPLLKQLIFLNEGAEIILHISKQETAYIVFDLCNTKGALPKTLLKAYENSTIKEPYAHILGSLFKAKRIAEAMGGSLTLENTKESGAHFIFKLPYIKDKQRRTHQNRLKQFLAGKKVLFVGNTRYDTKRMQYIFGIFGLKIDYMDLTSFTNKKPDLSHYFMIVLRSEDLTQQHIKYLKLLHKNRQNNFKLIMIHELFEAESKIEATKAIADAELYTPAIIGDVEEILYQMFILKSKAVKGISNVGTLSDPSAFLIKGEKEYTRYDMERFRGARIAVAEDSKIDQRIIRHMLNIEGIELFMVNNGSDLLDLLETEEIDFVFVDINMPVMDGLTAAEIIRRKEKWKNIPIISISSMSFIHELKKMQTVGMNGAITKPFYTRDIYRALELFLKVTPEMKVRYAKKLQQNDAASTPDKNTEKKSRYH